MQEKEDGRKESVLKMLRDMASSSEEAATAQESAPVQKEVTDEASSPDSHTTTPEPYSREGTMFTPSADKELEAILNREEAPSMPSRESSMKSRAVTGETETSGTYTSPETMSRNSKPSLPEEYIEEVDRQLATAAAQDSFNLPLALTPARSRLGMSPSGSMVDVKGSQLSLTQLSGRRTVISRETIREREKLNEHITSTYAGLSARYTDMIEDLVKIDQGLNVAAPGSSKYLTVPGEIQSLPSGTVSTEQSQQATTVPSLDGSASLESSSEGPGTGEVNSNSDSKDGEEEEEEDDGQVAVSLEIPVSEHQFEQSGTGAELMESSGGEGSTVSTEYPSLVAEDVAQSLLDDSGGENVPASTYAGSTTYYTGVPSEYARSDTPDSDESTLD